MVFVMNEIKSDASFDEIVLAIIKDLQAGAYSNGRPMPKVKKNLIWSKVFKKMDNSLKNLLDQGLIEKVDCCSNLSYRVVENDKDN